MKFNTNWVSHAEWLILVLTLIGGFYNLDGKIERANTKIDNAITVQAARSDRLYEMFIELVREKK